MRVAGIDVGLTGYVSVIQDGKIYIGSFRMPTKKKGKKKSIDGRKFMALLTLFEPDHCIIERQFQKYGQRGGATTSFNYGYLCGVLTAMNVPFETVSAQTWQKAILGKNIPDTKKASIASVIQFDKNIDLRKSEKAQVACHDKCDSICLARWFWKK